MSASPEIAVVIPTHQRRDLLLQGLAALTRQTVSGDRYEIVVVCDGCADGSAEAVRAWLARAHELPNGAAADPTEPHQPRFSADHARRRALRSGQSHDGLVAPHGRDAAPPSRAAARPDPDATGVRADAPWPATTMIEQENLGAAAARNRGVRAASASVLLFLDDDMIAAPDLLERHLARHAERPGGIVLGAIPVHPDSPRSYLTVGLSRWAERRHTRLAAEGANVPVEDVLTGQMSMSRATFEALGGFDPRFTAGGTFGGEDVDLGWRARKLSIPILYEPRAVSHQVFVKSFGSVCRDVRDNAAAEVRIARLHPDAAPLFRNSLRSLPIWERRAHLVTMDHPRIASALGGVLTAGLGLAARMGATGRNWEYLHAICRAHHFALGMRDAGAGKKGSQELVRRM